MFKLTDFRNAFTRIKANIHYTPVLTNQSLNCLTGSNLFFKCENFQKSGSFKIRGVMNKILQLSKEELLNGVVTASSGNHGAALSFGVKKLGSHAKVVMPRDTAKAKINNVKRYGGEIIWCEPNQNSRDEILKNTLDESSGCLVHPYDDKQIIIGQGTVALEFIEQHPDLDIIICPVSGGGLISGIAYYASLVKENIKVYGAEPEEADDTFRSLKSGKIEKNNTTNTICDGLRAQVGKLNFSIIRDKVEEIITVPEAEIIKAQRMILERMKIIVEPSCSITLAAIIQNQHIFKFKKVGVVLSGGNVDLDTLLWQKFDKSGTNSKLI